MITAVFLVLGLFKQFDYLGKREEFQILKETCYLLLKANTAFFHRRSNEHQKKYSTVQFLGTTICFLCKA